MADYESAADYLVAEQGVSREVIERLEHLGFRYMTMICPDIFEQAGYEEGLKQQFKPRDVKIIPLRGGWKSLLCKERGYRKSFRRG